MKHFDMDSNENYELAQTWTKITIPHKKEDAFPWCKQNGSEMRFAATIIYYWFENPADATLFALKWL